MRSLRLFLPSSLPTAVTERGTPTALPGLTRILSRARAANLRGKDLQVVLLESFGVQRQRDWPVAPLSWLGEGRDPEKRYWLRADPVHLRAERDALVLIDATHFTLESEPARSLVDALNAHFESQRVQFFAPHPNRWYAALDQVPEVVTFPLRSAAGYNIDRLLPQGNGALIWHRWFNEIQMLLHAHEVNEAREVADQPTVNSVWFWGGGVLPAVLQGGFAGVWGDDPLMRGLAQASGLTCAATPDHAARWLAQASEGEHLLLLEPVAAGQRNPLESLERRWFAPLLQALKQRRLAALTLLAESVDGTVRFELNAGDLWKFWRRAPALVQ
jgi:hypothetical protein